MADTEEPRLAWRKSSASDSGGCVEVAVDSGRVLIRDSKNPDGPVLRVSTTAWPIFVTAVTGEASIPGHPACDALGPAAREPAEGEQDADAKRLYGGL